MGKLSSENRMALAKQQVHWEAQGDLYIYFFSIEERRNIQVIISRLPVQSPPT